MIYIWHIHNSEIKVKVGDKLKKGTLIARTGNKGASSGPHHHLQAGNEIWQDGHIPYYDHTIDPTPYIDGLFDRKYPITGYWGQDYQALKPPIVIGGRYHAGIDHGTPIGTPVYCVGDCEIKAIVPNIGAICYLLTDITTVYIPDEDWKKAQSELTQLRAEKQAFIKENTIQESELKQLRSDTKVQRDTISTLQKNYGEKLDKIINLLTPKNNG